MAFSANTLLTPTTITRAALAVLHQKLTLIGNINRQYDDRFANSGAKIGEQLTIRMPNRFTVRSGTDMAAENIVEDSQVLAVSTRRGVDMDFTVQDLSLTIDDFTGRYIEPAMSVLAANIENYVASEAIKSIYNVVVDSDGIANVPNTFKDYLNARRVLQQGLAPGNDRSIHVTPAASVEIVDALKALFHDQSQVKKQYLEGMMGRAAGFDWYENTLMPVRTRGAGEAATVATSAVEGASTLALASAGVSKAIKAGDTFTIAGRYSCHPETKQSTGVLQRFVVTSDITTESDETVTVNISPPLYYSNGAAYPKQNLASRPVATDVVTWLGTADTSYSNMLALQKDAITFVTADLMMPDDVSFKARERHEGISMRILRQYTINNDRMPCRIDVHFGFKVLRPEWACRIEYAT